MALASEGDPVVAAAGDIACDPKSSSFNGGNGTGNSCRQKAVSDLLVNAGYSAVLLLGDNQYYCGSLEAFQKSYDLSWGRVKSITFPAVGNHEYLTTPASDRTGCDSSNTGAAGYFGYFGSAAGDPSKGYYSFNIGTWHVIVLNSSCSKAGGCSSSTPQGKWLRADLAAHANYCTMAYWHIPLFSSGGRANSTYKTFWDALYEADADLVLSSHDHTYERFAPQTPSGSKDTARGIRQFVVGTGGSNHTSFPGSAWPNSEVRNSTTFGVLKLTLRPTSYDWEFVPEAGKTFTDSGSQACHGQSSDTQPPSTPTGLTATSISSSSVSLSWNPSNDNVGVVGYDILRDGSQIGTSVGTSFTDNTVAPDTSYTYTVRARDAGGNQSGLSSGLPVTTPPGSPSTTDTFAPTADTYVRSDQTGSNFGSRTHLDVDGSPAKNILLRFNVSGIGANAATSAKLRLYVVDPSPSGGIFKQTNGASWTEGGVTWTTQPAAGATLGTLGAVSSGSWYEVDVSSYVKGDGTWDVVIQSTNSNGADYSSKEGAANLAPQLVVTK